MVKELFRRRAHRSRRDGEHQSETADRAATDRKSRAATTGSAAEERDGYDESFVERADN